MTRPSGTATLRIAFVSVIRPLFKGDSPTAATRSLEGLRALGEELGFKVVTPNVPGAGVHPATNVTLPPHAISDLDGAHLAAQQLAAHNPDLLLIQHTTFATGDLLAPLLHAAKRVGLWGLPESAGPVLEPVARDNGGGPLPLNALCGLNMTMSMLEKPALNKREPVKWFFGDVNSDWFRARLTPTIQALRGLKRVEGARILQIGGHAPGFFGLEESIDLPGVTVEVAPLKEFFSRIAAVPANESEARASEWAAAERSDVTHEQLGRGARIELALSSWAAEGSYDALAVRCWPELPEQAHSMACAAMGNVSSSVPAACEGDVPGALSMLALLGMSGRSSVLLDLSDIDEANGALQFWHCGNTPLEWAAGGSSRLTTHFNRDGVGVVRDMPLAAGPVTGFRLLAGGSQALIVSGTFGSPERRGYDGVHGWLSDLSWNGAPVDVRGFISNVLDHRLPHHFAFGRGELTEATRELCAWLGSEPLEAKPTRNTL